jgi:hypothetical protein
MGFSGKLAHTAEGPRIDTTDRNKTIFIRTV